MAAKGEIPALPLDDLELAAAVSPRPVRRTPPRSETPGAPGPPPISRRRLSRKTPCWMVPVLAPAPNLLHGPPSTPSTTSSEHASAEPVAADADVVAGVADKTSVYEVPREMHAAEYWRTRGDVGEAVHWRTRRGVQRVEFGELTLAGRLRLLTSAG